MKNVETSPAGRRFGLPAIGALSLAALAILTPGAQAQTTWDGGGGVSEFTTAAN